MTREMSKTQIDVGDRLRKGNVSDDDFGLLDRYRRSYSEAYEIIVSKVREALRLEPTGRPEKSTTSIVDKLRRESIRLTQIQDIAGCRLIVQDTYHQNSVVSSIESLLESDGIGCSIVDRRVNPSHGYRAVHIIVSPLGKSIEIQVRTALQHDWAELSERFSDTIHPAIKYGGGDMKIVGLLLNGSSMIGKVEELELYVSQKTDPLKAKEDIAPEVSQEIAEIQYRVSQLRKVVFNGLRVIEDVTRT